MRKIILLTLLVTLFFAMGCEKEKDKIPIDFKFRLLDTLGNESAVFNEGENIIFSFEVINNSSEDVYLKNFFPNHDFFRVYHPANGLLEFRCPWKSVDNFEYYCLYPKDEAHETFLPIGDFYTGFSQSFKIEENQTEEKHFKINFTIK